MDCKPKTKAEKKVSPSSESYKILSDCETSDGKIYEVGEIATALKDIDIEALLEMNAIAKEK